MESAFICDKNLFSHIYELDSRRSERDWPSTSFYQIKIKNETGNEFSIKEAGKKLLDILASKIRSSDVVCQINDDQYVLLLYDVDSNETERIKERISYHYHESVNKVETELEIDCKSL